MKKTLPFGLLLTLFVAAGCSTTGHFDIPADSSLYLYERPLPVAVAADGKVTTSPFFWSAAGIPPHGGIPYRLERQGETLKAGKLRTRFRVVSIFWPPFALIYWPMGLNPDITYDLINDRQE